MSRNEIPVPDALSGDKSPYSGFGKPLGVVPERFAKVVLEARSRIKGTFGASFVDGRRGVKTLEALIADMWSEDWNPAEANINLFVSDFGSVLTDLTQKALGGELIFRSEVDLSHVSIFWPQVRLEAFPFHKVYKRLMARDGESLVFFFDSLVREVRQQGS